MHVPKRPKLYANDHSFFTVKYKILKNCTQTAIRSLATKYQVFKVIPKSWKSIIYY